MQEIHYGLILIAVFMGVASPGPAILAIASTSMSHGRLQGLALASGILTGSLFWSCCAAFGLGALLYANVWLFEMLRYLGATYLLFLAYKSLHSALGRKSLSLVKIKQTSLSKSYFKGVAIHLTNPKAILFISALYTLGVPSTVTFSEMLCIVAMVVSLTGVILLGYALLFSSAKVRQGYLKTKRGFDGVFAAFFGFAGLKILLSKVNM